MDDISEVREGDLKQSNNLEEVGPSPSIKLVKKEFAVKFAISSDEFTNDLVRIILSNLIILSFTLLYN